MKSLRRVPTLAVVALLALVPLLSGCLTKSTTVGDQFSGRVLVAASPDAGPTTPAFDIPASLRSQVWATDFPSENAAPAPSSTKSPDAPGGPAPTAEGKSGAELSFDSLTAGQFSQLGDIIAAALPDPTATVDLKANRSGDFVRLRGSSSLAELEPKTSYLAITVDFAGPVIATNGQQTGDSTVTWLPQPGQTSDFNADSEYSDPATAAIPSWSWFMLLLCAAVIAFVAIAAFKNQDRMPRPGRVLPSRTFTRRSDEVPAEPEKSADD
ncbi:LppM family (lipo)protein [Gordonia zhaorongruii]|uniref:LppM family (lipo)protein n=1 Tax=Gordonia zhaorongruii TaxID=2597659 RepID=UPI0010442F79|nr:hypothetical protein [Gordonia zhaorongruii]